MNLVVQAAITYMLVCGACYAIDDSHSHTNNYGEIYFDGIQIDANVSVDEVYRKYGYVSLYVDGDAGQEDVICYVANDMSVVLFDIYWGGYIQGVTVADSTSKIDRAKCGASKEITFINKEIYGLHIGTTKNEVIIKLGTPIHESNDEIKYRFESRRKLSDKEIIKLKDSDIEYSDDANVSVVISIDLRFMKNKLIKYSVSRYSTL